MSNTTEEFSLTANIKLQILIHENCVLCRIVFANYLKLASFYWASLGVTTPVPASAEEYFAFVKPHVSPSPCFPPLTSLLG